MYYPPFSRLKLMPKSHWKILFPSKIIKKPYYIRNVMHFPWFVRLKLMPKSHLKTLLPALDDRD